MDTVLHLLPYALVFFAAGFAKGVIGLGLPTLAMALLALLTTPTEAAALLLVPALLTNIWQMRPWRELAPLTRRLAGLQLGACLG
ncbi:MAG: TSUP family transporter, partial [Myxococcota bacterium]